MNRQDQHVTKTKKLYVAAAMTLSLGLITLVLATLPGSSAQPTPKTLSRDGRVIDAVDPLRFGNSTWSVEEDAGVATITVTLETAPLVTATVDDATGDGSATAGEDYVAVSGTLTFGLGTTELPFTISIIDDTLDETDETVTLTLGNPVNGTLLTPELATLTIPPLFACSFCNPESLYDHTCASLNTSLRFDEAVAHTVRSTISSHQEFILPCR
jgi:hypothetical protein